MIGGWISQPFLGNGGPEVVLVLSLGSFAIIVFIFYFNNSKSSGKSLKWYPCTCVSVHSLYVCVCIIVSGMQMISNKIWVLIILVSTFYKYYSPPFFLSDLSTNTKGFHLLLVLFDIFCSSCMTGVSAISECIIDPYLSDVHPCTGNSWQHCQKGIITCLPPLILGM
jgi:hypothetical protein